MDALNGNQDNLSFNFSKITASKFPRITKRMATRDCDFYSSFAERPRDYSNSSFKNDHNQNKRFSNLSRSPSVTDRNSQELPAEMEIEVEAPRSRSGSDMSISEDCSSSHQLPFKEIDETIILKKIPNTPMSKTPKATKRPPILKSFKSFKNGSSQIRTISRLFSKSKLDIEPPFYPAVKNMLMASSFPLDSFEKATAEIEKKIKKAIKEDLYEDAFKELENQLEGEDNAIEWLIMSGRFSQKVSLTEIIPQSYKRLQRLQEELRTYENTADNQTQLRILTWISSIDKLLSCKNLYELGNQIEKISDKMLVELLEIAYGHPLFHKWLFQDKEERIHLKKVMREAYYEYSMIENLDEIYTPLKDVEISQIQRVDKSEINRDLEFRHLKYSSTENKENIGEDNDIRGLKKYLKKVNLEERKNLFHPLQCLAERTMYPFQRILKEEYEDLLKSGFRLEITKKRSDTLLCHVIQAEIVEDGDSFSVKRIIPYTILDYGTMPPTKIAELELSYIIDSDCKVHIKFTDFNFLPTIGNELKNEIINATSENIKIRKKSRNSMHFFKI